MKKIVVFTGAGISAESGLQTFRTKGGIWNKYKIEDVATQNAFIKNPSKVLSFIILEENNYIIQNPIMHILH